MFNKLQRDFYGKDTLSVAKNLLGKILVHEVNDKKLSGKIVETEAYKGVLDKAAHSYGNRRTKRTEALYGPCGFSYVFVIYGMYYCFNVVTESEGIPEGVLIRALEPITCLEDMSLNRYEKEYNLLSKTQVKNLTNGPGKLCKALLIDKSQNRKDLCKSDLYIEENNIENISIKSSKRIGIDYAEEAADYHWRFYIKDNPYISVK